MDLKVVVGRELGNGLRQGGVLEDVVWDALGLADETLLVIGGVGRGGRGRLGRGGATVVHGYCASCPLIQETLSPLIRANFYAHRIEKG